MPARRPAHRAALLVCAAVLLLAGCAISPATRQSLADYVQAMAQVEQGAELFLGEFADGQRQRDARRRQGGTPTEYPHEFRPPPDPAQPANDAERAVASTRQGLAAVHAYNDALVALAEGRPEAELRARTNEFGAALQTAGQLAGVALPSLAAFASVGARIVQLANDAANRQQLEQAVAQGRGPVAEILQALEGQTPGLYRLSVVDTSQGQQQLQEQIQRSAQALQTLLARHGPPTDRGVTERAAQTQARLAAIGQATRTLPALPVPFRYGAGPPAYDAGAQAQAEVFAQAIADRGQTYAELVARQNAYHLLLGKYVAALRQTRASLDRLADSLRQPRDLRPDAARLLQVAFELRDAMAAYRQPPLPPAP